MMNSFNTENLLFTRQSFKDQWNKIKHTNIHVMGEPERERRERGGDKQVFKNHRKFPQFINTLMILRPLVNPKKHELKNIYS